METKEEKPMPPKPFTGQIKGPRQEVLNKINGAILTAAQKAVLIEGISFVPAEVDWISVHWHAEPHGKGINGCFTVDER